MKRNRKNKGPKQQPLRAFAPWFESQVRGVPLTEGLGGRTTRTGLKKCSPAASKMRFP
jgi:hypothetical protein